jgi:hypothetical protein
MIVHRRDVVGADGIMCQYLLSPGGNRVNNQITATASGVTVNGDMPTIVSDQDYQIFIATLRKAWYQHRALKKQNGSTADRLLVSEAHLAEEFGFPCEVRDNMGRILEQAK